MVRLQLQSHDLPATAETRIPGTLVEDAKPEIGKRYLKISQVLENAMHKNDIINTISTYLISIAWYNKWNEMYETW